ncbi:MAG: VCBS repeat-containing protein [Flavobacteriales bacterium]
MSYCRLLILLAVLVTVNCSNAQFGPGQLVSDQHTVATAPGRLLPADVDADGDIDLVLRQLTDVLFFENANGQGDFAPADTIFVVDPIHHLALADMDYDAVLDMVMIVGPNSELIWVAGLGNGQFGSPQLITNFPNGAGAVLCRDVQPDPGPEVLVTSNGQVYIYAYDISTDTYALDDSVSYGGGPPTPVLMSGDVDLDGDVDILAVNWSGFMAMGVNNGPGEAWTSTLMVLTGLMYTNAGMDLVDVDGDGDLDVVDAKNSLKWARNRTVEDGVFGAFDIVDIATDAFAYGMGWVGSLGCGSRTSIIWHVWPWGEPVQWSAYSDQLNAFNGPVALMDSIRPAQLIAADLNGDGANDLLIADRDSSLIWWFPNLLPQTSPSATVVLTPFDTLCASGLSYVLDHAAPAGGSWSGPGVIDNVFTLSGEGIFQLVYTVADGGTGCPLSASQSIVVVQSPTLTVLSGDPFNGCATDPVIFSASPSGGTWAGIASSSGVVDRSCEARPSSGPVVYTMDAVNGGDCTAGGPTFFELLACTPVDLGPDQQVCMKEDTLMVTLQGPFIGAASLGGFDRVQFEPPSTVFGFFHPTVGPGVYEFTGTASGPGACPGFDTLLVTVVPGPSPRILSALDVCAYDSSISVEADTVGVFGGGLSGSGITSDPLDPSLLGPGSYPFTFAVTDANGCETVLVQNLIVRSLPEAAILSPLSVCAYDSSISVEADTVGVFGGGLSGSGITSDPLDPSLLGLATTRSPSP